MRTSLFTLCLFLTSVFTYGQALYSDNFDGAQVIMSSANNTVTYENGLVKISANGSGGNFEAVGYPLHENGTETVFDISSGREVFFKAKTTSNLAFRVDLKDSDGFASSANAITASVTGNEFTIYRLDFSGNLTEAQYAGSPCTPTTSDCSVDITKISELVFFLNPTTGGFNGTMEIEWLSIGEPLEALPPDQPELRYNQVSYFTGRDKIINIMSTEDFAPVAYQVFDSNNQQVMSGNSSVTSLWNAANEYISTIDISTIKTEGEYRLVTDFDEITFRINDSGYDELRKSAFKYYYFNRASIEITPELGGVYARPLGHPDTEVQVHSSAASAERPEGTIISSPKGWYDAGDYNKYVVNSGISTYTLLAAFEHYKSYYQNTDFNIPEEGGAIPDILDEVIWNLDWMVSMQDPNDGGVYHKLTGTNFDGIVMPHNYNFNDLGRYVVQKSTSAALNLAAVAAIASRIFEEYESAKPGYSDQLLQVAKDAYAWAKANPSALYESNPSGIFTGQYEDNNVSDEFQWAAVELFVTTKEEQYKNDINVASIGGGIPGWQYVDPLALITIANHASDLTGDINVTAANNVLIGTASNLRSLINNSPMKIAMTNSDYVWGSNGVAGNQIVLLIRAYELTGDESYLDAAYSGMDYLLGRNGTGYCFVSGFGDQPMMNPHHRISEADAVVAPVPGMVAGGPHAAAPGFDGCTGYPTNSSNATTYVDTWCSYSSNEVTINWNAPLVYAVNALHFYENQSTVLSVDEISENSDALGVFPNPTEGIVQITTSLNLVNAEVSFYTIQGKEVFTTNLIDGNRSINIQSFSPGLYLMEINTADKTYTEKVIKK